MVEIGAFRVFMRTLSLILRLNQPRSVLFSLGLTPEVEPKILHVNHVTQAVVRVGSKIGS